MYLWRGPSGSCRSPECQGQGPPAGSQGRSQGPNMKGVGSCPHRGTGPGCKGPLTEGWLGGNRCQSLRKLRCLPQRLQESGQPMTRGQSDFLWRGPKGGVTLAGAEAEGSHSSGEVGYLEGAGSHGKGRGSFEVDPAVVGGPEGSLGSGGELPEGMGRSGAAAGDNPGAGSGPLGSWAQRSCTGLAVE